MKNGNLSDFVDGLYYGYEMLFEYNGTKYFIQGWTQEGKCYMFLDMPDEKLVDYIWEYEAPTMRACAEAFLNEKLWNGQTFFDVERDITWSDW